MSEIKLSDNYRDLSVETGTDSGFQFEFYCEICGEAWRSDFDPYGGARATGWLRQANSLFGGALGGAADAADTVAQTGWRTAHDKALVEAIEEAKVHFHRCPRCTSYVCDKDWSEEAGLCRRCAPNAELEVEAAYASGKVYAVGEKAALKGIQDGKKMDVNERTQVTCPTCGATTGGAKFCPECGEKLAQHAYCTQCGAELPAGAKFCGECGTKQGE